MKRWIAVVTALALLAMGAWLRGWAGGGENGDPRAPAEHGCCGGVERGERPRCPPGATLVRLAGHWQCAYPSWLPPADATLTRDAEGILEVSGPAAERLAVAKAQEELPWG